MNRDYVPFTPSLLETVMIEKQESRVKEKAAPSISLETLIALGIFGWIALSMALMGLGIW